eukprot:66265-Pelagomonas_calceolata.AAC.1
MEFSSPDQFQEYAQGSGHSFVSIGLSQNSEELGSMLIELYTDVTPATCEHFMKGCKSTFAGGYKYESSPIHRVVKHGYIQGGDVVEGTGKGNPGFSIPDETFQIKHEEHRPEKAQYIESTLKVFKARPIGPEPVLTQKLEGAGIT